MTAAVAAFCLVTFASDLGQAESAPQQAAAAAMTLAWVVIPYVFTRAMEGLFPATTQDSADSGSQKKPEIDIGAGQY